MDEGVVDSTSGPWAYRIVVTGRGRVDTLSRVLLPYLLTVTDSVIAGIQSLPRYPFRSLFVLDRTGGSRLSFRVPRDAWSLFNDFAISPNGRYLAYVAVDSMHRFFARVRELASGRRVATSVPALGCDCDIDRNHARWVSADSFEIAVDGAGEDGGYLLFSGSTTTRKTQSTVTRTPPRWHD